jgi:NifU-like protein involved in Fe-S cluster formation
VIEDVYQTELLRLAARASGAGRLAAPDASATVDNPLCGDRITVDLQLAGGRITAIGYEVRACVLCQASATLIGSHAPGAGQAELQEVADAVAAMLRGAGEPPGGRWADYARFLPVRAHKSRYDCVTLPFQALLQALAAGAPTDHGS